MYDRKPPAHENPFEFLRAATPYVRQFRNRIFVIKIGGDLLAEPEARQDIAEQLSLLHHFSIKLVLVHGGGPQVDELCRKLDIPIRKIAGRRVTTPEALEVTKMVLAGSVQMDLLAEMRSAGLPVVGLSGVDAGLTKAQRRPPVMVVEDAQTSAHEVDYGLVGDIVGVDASILETLVNGGFVPLVAPLSGSDKGEIFNTNADSMAAALAVALKAEKLFFLLRVPGILQNAEDPLTLVNYMTLTDLRKLEESGAVKAGMRPKVAAIQTALKGGVKRVHLISGFKPDALLREIFTNEGSGTMVVDDA